MSYGISLNNDKLTSFEDFQKTTYFYVGKIPITFRSPELYGGNYTATATLSESNVPIEDLIYVVSLSKNTSSTYNDVYVGAVVGRAKVSGSSLEILYGTYISDSSKTYTGHILIFRKRQAKNKGTYGIELFDSGGQMYFSSTDYPLVSCESSESRGTLPNNVTYPTSTLQQYSYIGYISSILGSIIAGSIAAEYFSCICFSYLMGITGKKYKVGAISTNFTSTPLINPITMDNSYSGTKTLFVNTYPYL